MRQKLKSTSKNAIEQRQAAGAKMVQRKKTARKTNSGLSDYHKHDEHNTNESQNSQSHGETDLNEMDGLNISSKIMTYGGGTWP